MNRGDKLNGPSLQEQSSAAISKLQADTQALNALKTAVSNFNAGDELKGTSISGMKQQLNDYLTVIDAEITANDVDVEDFQTLSSTAGGEVIDGTAILDEWDSAKEGKDSAERAANNARGWASFFQIFDAATADILKSNAEVYDRQADTWQEIITWCQEQSDKFDQIKSTTDRLFAAGPSLRDTTAKALADIAGSFQVNGYAPNMNAGWRTTINKKEQYIKAIQLGLVNVDEDGNMEPNWSNIEKILQKDAKNITDTEYGALALLYLTVEDNELDHFIKYCMDKGENQDFNLIQELIGGQMDYSTWTVNNEKLIRILGGVNAMADCALAYEKAAYCAGNQELFIQFQEQRDSILQRAALLSAVQKVGEFRNEIGSAYPDIKITVIKDDNGNQNLMLDFKGEKLIGSDYSPKSLIHLGDSKVTVYATRNGTEIDNFTIDHAENIILSKFGTTSTSKAVGSFAVDEITGEILSKASEDLIKGMGGKVIPVIGDAAFAFSDYAMEIMENEENGRVTKEEFENIKKAEIYSDLNCSVV